MYMYVYIYTHNIQKGYMGISSLQAPYTAPLSKARSRTGSIRP